MRNAPLWPTLALAALLLAGAGRAEAQRGVDAALFHLPLDGYGLLGVERARTQPAYFLGVQLLLDFADHPLVLDLTDPLRSMARRQAILDWQLIGHLGVTLGLTDWLEVALQLPLSAQSFAAAYGKYGDPADPLLARSGFYLVDKFTNVPPPNAGPLDLPLGLKARLLRAGSFGLAALAVVTLPFGDEAAFLGDSSFTFRPKLVADFERGRLTLALNLGAIVRQTTSVRDPYEEAAKVPQPRLLISVGHELTWAAAAAVRLTSWLSVLAQIDGYEPLTQLRGATPDRTIDLIGGVQLRPADSVVFTLGAGAGVLDGAARRDRFRLLAGVSWSPWLGRSHYHAQDGGAERGADLDGDGIPDLRDRCPTVPEDQDGFADQDGCPDPDNDGDGIPDTADACPNQPEDHDGFADDDGCPDPDNDGDGIPDTVDACPDDPETPNGVDDQDGCPDGEGGPIGRADPGLPVGSSWTGRLSLLQVKPW